MGLFVYRASPRGAGVPVLVRWLATATVLAVALHFVPQPEGSSSCACISAWC